ncbi:MAG TPA: peptidoglycan editing factor PgeF [Acidobacteriaceae bacterium]|nr:peptidoglycan editing factor PgeF [Acidobacteriaceae bacterium]
MKNWLESTEAIGQVDDLLASVGLGHGKRETRAGTWAGGERVKRKELPAREKGRKAAATDKAGVVRAEGWEKYAWLRHGFSRRAGGVSKIYDDGERGTLNLGFTKEDDAANVGKNRARFLREVAGKSAEARLVTLRQIHSGMVRVIGAGGVEGVEVAVALETAEGKAVLRGDGVMTDVPGVMLGVQVADCVPVLVADVRRKAVAAFHAGWRGTLARIVERGIGTMQMRYGSRPEDLVAVVGPSIGACCYGVGEEVRFEFESQFAYGAELFSEVYDSDPVREKYPLLFMTMRAPGHSNIGPQIHLDLAEANRRQLLDAGLKAKRISVVGECTACARVGERRKYFSHRGESGFAGRMMGMVGVI